MKLVADGFPGTWGTWYSPPIERTLDSFSASFRFSFKNADGGAGDGFSFLWGDLSDAGGNRPEGGEYRTRVPAGWSRALDRDQRLHQSGNAGIDGRWGGTPFAFTPMSFEGVTYPDYQTAGRPESMPTMTVDWRAGQGVTVSIAFPFEPPQVVYQSQGVDELAGIDPTNWGFGFAGRNGAIDMDVLVGDLVVTAGFVAESGGLGAGPGTPSTTPPTSTSVAPCSSSTRPGPRALSGGPRPRRGRGGWGPRDPPQPVGGAGLRGPRRGRPGQRRGPEHPARWGPCGAEVDPFEPGPFHGSPAARHRSSTEHRRIGVHDDQMGVG